MKFVWLDFFWEVFYNFVPNTHWNENENTSMFSCVKFK